MRIFTAAGVVFVSAAISSNSSSPAARSSSASRSARGSFDNADSTTVSSDRSTAVCSDDGSAKAVLRSPSSGARNIRRAFARPARRFAMLNANASGESGAPCLRHRRTSAASASCAMSSAVARHRVRART
jgi:hypothetical protein